MPSPVTAWDWGKTGQPMFLRLCFSSADFPVLLVHAYYVAKDGVIIYWLSKEGIHPVIDSI